MIWKILNKTELVVQLPFVLKRHTIYPLIDSVLDEKLNPKASKVIFDFSGLSFIDPVGVTVLSNLIEVLKKSGVKSAFSGLEKNTESIRYLNDSGFFQYYLKKPVQQKPNLRSTTLPLELVEYSKSYEYMGFTLIPWLANELSTSEKSLATAKGCLQEIFNNIEDHSGVSIGCSFVQHYPRKSEIQICISDFGVGIPSNVRKLNPDLSDHLAISKACTQGYTTQTTPRNRGAGLHVLVQNVANRNKGLVSISSLSGITTFFNESGSVRENTRAVQGFYPGTLIQIFFDTRRFIFDEEDEDFEW